MQKICRKTALSEHSGLLEKNSADYEIIAHDSPILKTEDAKKYFDITKTAPALIIKTDRNFLALIFSPRAGKIDFGKLGKEAGYNKFRLAGKNEVMEATGYETGAVPLIGHNLPCLFDSALLGFDYIYGGTGSSYHTLKIKPGDIIFLLADVIIINV